MRHRELAVLARLIEHGRDVLARKLGYAPALGVDPDLDEVGAVLRDLVDMLAGRFGSLVVVAIAGKRREAIPDRENARATQVTGLLLRLVFDDVVGVGRHAGRGGDAIE